MLRLCILTAVSSVAKRPVFTFESTLPSGFAWHYTVTNRSTHCDVMEV